MHGRKYTGGIEQVRDLLDAPLIVTAGEIAAVIGDADKIESCGIVRVAHSVEQGAIEYSAVLGDIGMTVQIAPH